jgi:ESCRT-II complex subunit VPS36
MGDIEEVMFSMGMIDTFTSHVSKEISGKKFYVDLAKELASFLDSVIEQERFSGVIGLIDLFCLYNRARGTDLVSPNDLKIACVNLDSSSKKYMLKTYTKSGIKCIQLRSFNEKAYF